MLDHIWAMEILQGMKWTVVSGSDYECMRCVCEPGSSGVDEGEFVAGFKEAFGGTDDQAKKAFARIDSDGSGEISLSEISDFFKQMDNDGKDPSSLKSCILGEKD